MFFAGFGKVNNGWILNFTVLVIIGMKMAKKMMILGASALQVPAIKKAKEMGYEVISVDYDPEAVGFALADVKLVVSTLDQEEVLRQARIYEPDVVITSTSDGPVRTAAYVNEKLGKQPDLAYEDSLCATIKSYMRERLKECNVPIPQYFVVQKEEEFYNAVTSINGDLIVKPADNAGSRGVVLIKKDTVTGKTQPEDILSVYEYSKNNSRNGTVMVEEFMDGEEVSVEAMTVEGRTNIITITDKITTPPPYFVELGHVEPSRHPFEVQEKIKEITKMAVAAIRLQNGPSHTEIKLTKDGPKIVELAARLGGDFITSRLVPLSTGVDMVGNSVMLATGGNVDLEAKWNKGAAICFISGGSGVIQNISVPDAAYQMPGVEEIVLYKKSGDVVDGTKSSNDRLGHVIATGKDAEEAFLHANAIRNQISVIYEV